MKLLFSAISAYRYFSTKTTSKSAKWGQNSFKNRNKNEPTNPRGTKIKWTDQQSQILDAISEGKSVFITGSAGTGKTVLLKHMIKSLNKVHGPSRVLVTASTGVAACALKGQTLHSFAGVGLAEGDSQTVLDRVVSDRRAYSRWNRVKALVIDEISMVNADFFGKLDHIAREVRDEQHGTKDTAWGGIQLVVSGDFFQLPPVFNMEQMEGMKSSRGRLKGKEFAFEADCWNASFDMQVELTKVFRQSDDKLIKLLQGIRKGESDLEDLRLIEERCSEIEPGSSAVMLYPRTEDVNKMNKKQMESLGEEIVIYRALDWGEDRWRRQLEAGIAPSELELCVGARVMLTKNINPWKKLVNGATGTIIDFYEPDDIDDVDVTEICERGVLPVVRFDSGEELAIDPDTWVVMEGEKMVASREQIPLILAWALSIHKCQGMTLDSLHTDLSRAFGCGMVYVALSRIRNLDGLHISGFCPLKIKAHPKVLEFYQSFASEQDKKSKDDEDTEDESVSGNLVDMRNIITCGGTKNHNYLFKFEYLPQKENLKAS